MRCDSLAPSTTGDTQVGHGLNTAGILSRIDRCSPDAIKSWLETRGFQLVAFNPNSNDPTNVGRASKGLDPRGTVDETAPGTQARGTPTDRLTETTILPQSQGLANETIRKHVRPTAIAMVDLTTDDPPEPVERLQTSPAIKFSNQGIEAHGLVALSKYFATKMTTLDAYIPLSVFNTQWLRQDLLQQSIRKRSVKEKLEDTYIGLTVPLEWKMTFGEWVVAFDLFITYLEHYKWGELATKFKGHKENVFAIKRENSNWPVAFRYDLAVRTAVMTFRLPDGSVANPSIRDARIEREAIRETERLKDFSPAFKEINPYADGEAKASVDPITGVDSRNGPNSATHGFNRPTHRSQSFSNNAVHNNLPVYDGPGGSSSNAWDDRRGDNHPGRFRSRRGSWHGNQGARERPPQRRRLNGGYDGWRKDDRRDESRTGDKDVPETSGKTK